MTFLNTLFKQRSLIPVTLAVIFSVLFIIGMVQAATTISTDITTGGNIYATSTLVVDGNVTLGDAAGDVIIITGNASTTNALTVGGDFFVNGNATTTSADGNISTEGTLTVAGATILNGNVTLGDAGTDTLTVTANASTTEALTVGGDLFVNGNATTTSANGNFTTEGTVGVASTTPAEELGVTGDAFFSSAATTTLFVHSTDGMTGAGCIEMTGSDGVQHRIYINLDDSTSLIIEAGNCQ